MNTATRILATLAVIGGLAAAVGGGATFATFNAQTTNGTNTFTAGTMTMTNVAGSVAGGSDCSSDTYSSTCATLFTLTNLAPGASDSSNTVAITYTGSITTGDFRLFASAYSSKTGSSDALCTATDPASQLDLQVKAGATIVYPTSGSGYGTLADFAGTYTTSSNGLQMNGGTNGSGSAGVWANGDSATYTINVHVDSGAGNTYQGCQSSVSLTWYAAQ